MNLVTTTGELGGYIFRQKFCITSCHKYIHIIFAKIAIQNNPTSEFHQAADNTFLHLQLWNGYKP